MNGKALKCNLCSEELNSSYKLNLHTERQHGGVRERKKESFQCQVCAYGFKTGNHLIDHMRMHPGERPFKCKVTDCGITFKLESNLNDHIKYKHSDERPFKCDFSGCLHTAKTSANLSKHKKINSEERPFACPNSGCSFRTKWKTDINRHVKCVHKESPAFACSNCDYKTARNDHLKLHTHRHSARRDFKCNRPHCKESFKFDLRIHFSDRREESYVKCCYGRGQCAITKEPLKDHVKLHDNSGRPFKCPLCFKRFKTLWYMQDHCVVHTNEKPFKCGYCDYAAARQAHVKTHISLVHDNIEFPFIVHLLDDRECLRCKVILPSAEFLIHSKGHEGPVVMM